MTRGEGRGAESIPDRRSRITHHASRFTFHVSRFTSRTALVTGGGTGIGRGIALALARRGVNLALVGRRAALLEKVAAEAGASGVRAAAIPADLSVAGELGGVIERVRSRLGPVDILVNNAGVLAGGDLSTLTEDEVRHAVAVNLLAPIELTRQALPDLTARRGAVVLVASGMSYIPYPSASLYVATKTGLRAFGESLRYELEPVGVRLLAVYPPGTDTAMVRGMAKALRLPAYLLADPLVVGERIVRALAAGKRELHFGGGERALTVLYRIAPGLVRAVLRTQTRRFARMMGATRRKY